MPIKPESTPDSTSITNFMARVQTSAFLWEKNFHNFVDFESVLAMEHTSMVRMFKTLEETWLMGFLEASDSVYAGVVLELFANAKVVAGTVISFIANRILELMKEVFAKYFGLPTEGMASFLDIPTKTVVDMRRRFSVFDVPFRAPNKKKDMKMVYRLLHDIVAKELCAKAGSFDVVTSEKFDLMVAISASLKVNWAQILRVGEVEPAKSVDQQIGSRLYKKKIWVPAGETSKVSGATASEQQSTADSLPSLTDKDEKEADEKKKPGKEASEMRKSTTRDGIPSSAFTRRPDEIGAEGFSSSRWAGNNFPAKRGGGGGGGYLRRGRGVA
ncbi:hypothetical protein F511_24415 [Dorcoceras hygrometricum]|uniref:Uncharacterized protein n=1 Tax=Dorcoceras hygrometricum TaxID=472368 RepID=A0A2Z7CAD0_9LAMI|nr:hypothetical protein F511_24415 [Dorcoceras hygrometricum]